MKRSLSQRGNLVFYRLEESQSVTQRVAAGPGGRAAGRQAVVDVEDHGLAPKRIKAEVPTLSGPLRTFSSSFVKETYRVQTTCR